MVEELGASSCMELLRQSDAICEPPCSSSRPAFLVENGFDAALESSFGKTIECSTADTLANAAACTEGESCPRCSTSEASHERLCSEIDRMLAVHHRRVELAIHRVVQRLGCPPGCEDERPLGFGMETPIADQTNQAMWESDPMSDPMTPAGAYNTSNGESWASPVSGSSGHRSPNCQEYYAQPRFSFTAAAKEATRMPSTQSADNYAAARRVSMEASQIYSSKQGIPMPEQHCWLRRRLLLVTRHTYFHVAGAILILTNSALIGAEVDHMARHSGEETPVAFVFVHHVYTILFTVELLLRLVAEGKDFIRIQGAWNLLDAFIVLCALFESATDIFTRANSEDDMDGPRSVNVVRIVRVIKFLRLIRVLRIPRIIRFVGGLRTLVHSVACTLKELFWSVVLLVLLIYIAGIIFCQAAIEYQGHTEIPNLLRFWGTLPDAMLTLFMMISNGVSWIEPLTPLRGLNIIWVYASVCYIFFTYFAVLNVITGIFCNSAIETAARDPDLAAQSLLATKKKYMEKVRALFYSVDADESGNITLQELETLMNNESMLMYFQAMGLDTNDAWALFKLMDVDNTHTIDIEEFVAGVMRLKGSAKSIDVAMMNEENKEMMRKIWKTVGKLQAQMERFADAREMRARGR